MKKVLILFGARSWDNTAIFENQPMYKQCYEELYVRAAEQGLQFYRGSYEWYDSSTKTFNAWTFVDDAWTQVENITPDIVYEKVESAEAEATLPIVREIAKEYTVVDPVDFSYLIDNKLYASLLFPEYIKPYTFVQSPEEMRAAFNAIDGEMVVAKTSQGSGGKGVFIDTKEQLLQADIPFPVIVQEFVDTSAGIDGVVEGYHDLRVMVINEEIVYAYVRTPAEGSLLANVAQGGEKIIIDSEQVPEPIFPIVKDVQKRFAVYGPTIYSIDFFFDADQRPWIVEFNAKPGMFYTPEQRESMLPVHDAFIDFFLNIG